ncbi:hypothetical protein [Kordia zhangzhouensis]|uniref:hypothetical protein n=1 Tax=Kordia zhangzhouensis TaxID=1620405 RepID=UPI0006297DEE|nr:hypothetical protein [Kordia zhangzhouensis]
MKKQKLTLSSLKLTKVRVANLQVLKGGDNVETNETFCCTDPIVCHPTLTTRPDSMTTDEKKKDSK